MRPVEVEFATEELMEPPVPGEITIADSDAAPAAVEGELLPPMPPRRNLAEALDPTTLDRIGTRLVEWVDADIESRQGWHDRFEAGLKKAGVIGEPDKPEMEGGSIVVHPLLVEAATQFQARAIEEMFPSSGPVKGKIMGEATQELEAQRTRVEDHMNWQLLEEDEEYFEDTDKMLFALPFAGSAFKKTYYDDLCGYVTTKFVQAEDVIVPYTAKSLKRSPRITHRFAISQNDYKRAVVSGLYREINLGKPQQDTEQRKVIDLADKASPSDIEEDQEFTFYEVSCDWDLSKDGKGMPLPYLITVDRDSSKVVAIYENWKPEDEHKRKRVWFTHYRYLPGLGFYGYGLFHAIGGLGDAATGTLRSLLDSAGFANFQGGFTSTDARLPGKQVRLKMGTYQALDMSPEEMAKAFYTPPFKEPSQAMRELLEFVVGAGQRFASISDAMLGEEKTNVPVGTTIARIEQATKVYSAIHKRCHKSAQEEFRQRARLNYEYLDEVQEFDYAGKNLVIYRQDYSDVVDVIPVSDPNIVSTPQRIATAEALVQRAMANPLYDRYQVEKRFLTALRVADIDQILPEPGNEPPCDPVTEGAALMMGKAAKAFIHQHHQAHIAVHMVQLESLKGSPIEKIVAPLIMSHIQEHYGLGHQAQVMAQLGIQLPPPGSKQALPPEIEYQMSVAMAQFAGQMMQGLQMANPEAVAAQLEVQLGEQKLREGDIRLEQENVKLQSLLAESERAGEEAQARFDMQLEAMRMESQQALDKFMAEQTRRHDEVQKRMDDAIRAAEAKAQAAIDAADATIVKANIDADSRKEIERMKIDAQRELDEKQRKHEAEMAEKDREAQAQVDEEKRKGEDEKRKSEEKAAEDKRKSDQQREDDKRKADEREAKLQKQVDELKEQIKEQAKQFKDELAKRDEKAKQKEEVEKAKKEGEEKGKTESASPVQVIVGGTGAEVAGEEEGEIEIGDITRGPDGRIAGAKARKTRAKKTAKPKK